MIMYTKSGEIINPPGTSQRNRSAEKLLGGVARTREAV